MKCVFLDFASISPEDLDLSRLQGSCRNFDFYDETSRRELLDRISSAEILVTNKVIINAEAIAAATRLKCIVVTATGTNNIDLDAAKLGNIVVSNVRNYGSNTVAQHAMTLILALSTNLLNYIDDVQSGEWATNDTFGLLNHPIQDLAGKHLVIVGSGAIGQAMAKIAHGFDMQVSFSASLRADSSERDRDDDRLPLAELLPAADILSLHLPLTPETTDLISTKEFLLMKRSALVINTARGGLVNEKALVAALDEGLIAGAGFDVLTEEPPKNGNPLIDTKRPNLIVTPHCAWGSREARQRLLDDVAASIEAFIDGEPRNRVA